MQQAEPGETLRTTQLIALALVFGPLVLLGVAWFVPLDASLGWIAMPIGLLGLISPVAAYWLYHSQHARVSSSADEGARCQAFLKATILALAVAEAVALIAIVGFALSQNLMALTGVATHVLVAGAVWPSPQRLELFLGRPVLL